MNCLVIYATTEGHTRRVARFMTEVLGDLGARTELLSVEDATELDLTRYDRVILAGSVHINHLQKSLERFATAHAEALSAMPGMLVAVSLAAAGEDAEDWSGLRALASRFQAETGWTNGQVVHVAGAFRFGEYDFFRAWAMRWIASQKGQHPDLHGDTVYTDWDALRGVLRDWLGR